MNLKNKLSPCDLNLERCGTCLILKVIYVCVCVCVCIYIYIYIYLFMIVKLIYDLTV